MMIDQGPSDAAVMEPPEIEPQVGPTDEVAPQLSRLGLPLVNVYFFGSPGAADRSWALIDAGLAGSSSAIIEFAARRFGERSRPAAIILTHGHFDHVGALPDVADYWDAPIYAHKFELPYLTGRSSYPPPDPAVGGGLMSFASRIYPRGPYDFGDRVHVLPNDASVPGMPGWRWLFTPGHSPGHVSLFRDSDRTLIVGDAFVTVKQESAFALMIRKPEVRRPPAYFTPDWETARRSVAKLAKLHPEVAATGHGSPMRGEAMRRQLEELARDWDQIAVPRYGRYVNRPAITDESGLVSAPPSVLDPNLLVAGVGAAALAGFFLSRRG